MIGVVRSVMVLCAALALAGVVGCSGGNSPPWNYNTPPNAFEMSEPAELTEPPENPSVVIGDFRNPPNSPLAWMDIGPGVSRSLAHAMLNDGKFEVIYNRRLAEEVHGVLELPSHQWSERFGEIGEKNPYVTLVVIGTVTDFHHTNEMPREVGRRGLFGHKREAIVAIRLAVVDLPQRRVLLSDHVYGTRKAGTKSTEELYGQLAFGTYLFWNSPLGRATEAAIDRAVDRIDEVVPADFYAAAPAPAPAPAASSAAPIRPVRVAPAVRIARLTSARRVELTGPGVAALQVGQEFYLSVFDDAVYDPHTGRPIRVRILTPGDRTATGWLLGQHPAHVDPRGGELRDTLPGTAAAWPAKRETEPVALGPAQ